MVAVITLSLILYFNHLEEEHQRKEALNRAFIYYMLSNPDGPNPDGPQRN